MIGAIPRDLVEEYLAVYREGSEAANTTDVSTPAVFCWYLVGFAHHIVAACLTNPSPCDTLRAFSSVPISRSPRGQEPVTEDHGRLQAST